MKTTRGDLLSVTQREKTPLAIGQKVLVITGSQARIVVDYTVATTEPTPSPKLNEPPAPPKPADAGDIYAAAAAATASATKHVFFLIRTAGTYSGGTTRTGAGNVIRAAFVVANVGRDDQRTAGQSAGEPEYHAAADAIALRSAIGRAQQAAMRPLCGTASTSTASIVRRSAGPGGPIELGMVRWINRLVRGVSDKSRGQRGGGRSLRAVQFLRNGSGRFGGAAQVPHSNQHAKRAFKFAVQKNFGVAPE